MAATRLVSHLALPLAGLLIAAAGTASASGDHGGGHDAQTNGGHGHEFAFGDPARGAAPERTIRIEARDTMTFEPGDVVVRAGEVVRFVVHNAGKMQHSFTVGTIGYQRQHESDMQEMATGRMATHMDSEPNGMVIQPGETESLTWRFTSTADIQFACHLPGHYQAGMKGRIALR